MVKMSKYKIVTTVLIERTYEVDADSQDEAEKIYLDKLPQPVKEKYCDWFEGAFEVSKIS